MSFSNYLWVLFVAVGVRCQAGSSTNASTNTDYTGRMFGGSETTSLSHPYMVSLRKKVHFCGGAIVNDRHVLTAAHCVTELSPKDYLVSAGVTDLCSSRSRYQNPQYRSIEFHSTYPAYIGSSSAHDIAVIRVHEPFQFNMFVAPVVLAPNILDPLPQETCVTVGWGITTDDPKIKGISQEANKLIPHRYKVPCVLRSGYVAIHQTACVANACHGLNTIVAGYGSDPYHQGSNARACAGDSGSPLVCGGKIYGVVSSSEGPECLVENSKPVLYSRVGAYITWINSIISQ